MYTHHVINGTIIGTFEIGIVCTGCDKFIKLVVPKAGYDAWKGGRFIQDVLPTLTPGERELLVSGICGDCFNAMFPDE